MRALLCKGHASGVANPEEPIVDDITSRETQGHVDARGSMDGAVGELMRMQQRTRRKEEGNQNGHDGKRSD
jgi:hypothetical protein